ncbi:hypothetical protein [Parasitella parasitica]|uniref:Uncharacterized protein n=1 Tax=Parasitella parasitica TaxID=35722 RepID=A0A0B7N5V1_9FUNG|nr:hypothetical protein [Parasitella parasitica]
MKPTRSIEKAKRSSRSYRRNNNPFRGLKAVDAYRQAEPSIYSNAAETSSNARLTIPSSEISGDTEASIIGLQRPNAALPAAALLDDINWDIEVLGLLRASMPTAMGNFRRMNAVICKDPLCEGVLLRMA